MNKPNFLIKNHFQKRSALYSDFIHDNILRDICQRLTQRSDYTVDFDDTGYNKGRLAELDYDGNRYFITFSETETKQGRNYSFQSVASALNTWAIESHGQGNLYFYFLPMDGNYESAYYLFMYRLLQTIGVNFLNAGDYLSQPISNFITADDLILTRNANRSRKASNNSSYITIDENRTVQIYAKTYGANKYESTIFGMALSKLTTGNIEMYQISEGGLVEIPERSQQALDVVGNGRIKVIPTNITMEISDFNNNDSLRSPQYMYNLLSIRGAKKCAFCNCNLPEIIQGAHIWGVSQIKKAPGLSLDEKIRYATDGENGLWLCENHHKMLDSNVISINNEGRLILKSNLLQSQRDYIESATPITSLPNEVVSAKFRFFLSKRNIQLE